MQDILTITLNPAVDLATSADSVSAGPKLRCAPPKTDPGGGGINVSRAIRQLGGQSRALVAICGPNGKKLRHLLMDEGIAVLPVRAPGETRLSLAVTDNSSGQQFRFVMPGPAWDEAHVKTVLDTARSAVPDEGYVVLSGSMPPGVPASFPAQLCAVLGDTGARVVSDTSGPALDALANVGEAAPYVLRMDQHEAEGLAGRALPSRRDSVGFAGELVARGAAQIVVVARGADGSVLASAHQRLHALAADVPVVSKVGAGDSFVGAFTLALARGCSHGEALQRGAAAASAAVMTGGTELCRRDDAEALIAQCPLSDLS